MSALKAKLVPILALLGFNALSDGDLLARAFAVVKGLTANAAFPTLPLDLAVFNTTVNAFSAAIAAALDGGKNAKAARDNQRRDVIQDLKILAAYVEKNCKDDMETFSSSGFLAKTRSKAAPQPIGVGEIRKLDFGPNSSQLMVTLKKVPGARSYNLRYALLTGTTPGTWIILPVANVKKAVLIGNLTPGATYAFAVQALGSEGFSDWSDSSTIMCV